MKHRSACDYVNDIENFLTKRTITLKQTLFKCHVDLCSCSKFMYVTCLQQSCFIYGSENEL